MGTVVHARKELVFRIFYSSFLRRFHVPMRFLDKMVLTIGRVFLETLICERRPITIY